MTASLKYGSSQLGLSLSDFEVLEPGLMRKIAYPRAAVLDALKSPESCRPLCETASVRKNAAIVVSDRTRTTKADVVLPVIIGELNKSGIEDRDISIVFATGTHPSHTEADMKKIVGPFVWGRKLRFLDHDCRDDSNLVELGRTARGNRVRVSRFVAEADMKILTGGITYHYFAGFGGGRKSVLPGISAFDTIQYNHKLVMSDKLKCRTGNLEGNPVHLDMLEAAGMVAPDFIVNTVLNGERELSGVFAGDLEAAHKKGCGFIDRHARAQIESKADLVIASAGGGTKDLNFVQSHKAMENASYALRDGGTMILVASAAEGFPSGAYMKYVELGSSKRIEEELMRDFSIPGHTIYSAMRKAERFRIIWVTELDHGVVRKFGITPVSSLDEALKLSEAGRTYVMPEAYLTLPVVHQEQD